MAGEATVHSEETKTKTNDRTRAIIEILVIMGVGLPFSISALFVEDQQSALALLLPVVSVFVSLAMTCVFAKLNGYGWKEFGLNRPTSWSMTAVWGFVCAIIFMVITGLAMVAFNALFKVEPDMSRFEILKNNPAMLAMGIFSAWFVAAIPEEVIFRGYMLGRLSKSFGGQRVAWITSAVVISVIFGVDHFYQGPAGIFATGFVGLLFCFAFMIFRRNLWILIIAHGLIDTLAFISIYANANQ